MGEGGEDVAKKKNTDQLEGKLFPLLQSYFNEHYKKTFSIKEIKEILDWMVGDAIKGHSVEGISAGLNIDALKDISKPLYEPSFGKDPAEMNENNNFKKKSFEKLLNELWVIASSVSPSYRNIIIYNLDKRNKEKYKKFKEISSLLEQKLKEKLSKSKRQKLHRELVRARIECGIGSGAEEWALHTWQELNPDGHYIYPDGKTYPYNKKPIRAQKMATWIIDNGGLIMNDGKLKYMPTWNKELDDKNKHALTNYIQRVISSWNKKRLHNN